MIKLFVNVINNTVQLFISKSIITFLNLVLLYLATLIGMCDLLNS